MKPRILSVDDHQDTLSMLRALLGSMGYEFAGATSVAEGLRMAKDEDFDLYLLDYMFTDGTGQELCARIREFDHKTPILFFSGSHPNIHQKAMTCGAQGFVMKPDFDALRQEIRRALQIAA